MNKSFGQFDNEQRNMKNKIVIIATVIILFLSIALLLSVTQKSFFIFNLNSRFNVQLLPKEICLVGFDSIVQKQGVESLVISAYLKSLEDGDYPMVDFKVDTGDYRYTEMLNPKQCKIILKDKSTSGHGLRSFIINLDLNQEHIFNYKIAGIYEVLLEEADLKWR